MDNIECIDDVNVENLDNNTANPKDEVVTNEELESEPITKIQIAPSIWSLQELLLFGYHPRKSATQPQILNTNKNQLLFIMICAVLYLADVITDIFLFLLLLKFSEMILLIIVLIIIIFPSVTSNITHIKGIWKTKEYKTWTVPQRTLWWIIFPFYYIFNLEPLFQYYKNFKYAINVNKRKILSKDVENQEVFDQNEIGQILEDYEEGVSNVANIKWLHATLHDIPILTFVVAIFDFGQLYNEPVVAMSVVTSMIGVLLSNSQFTKSYFIKRNLKVNNILIFVYTFITSVVIFCRVLILTDIFVNFLVFSALYGHETEHIKHVQGWVRPTLLLVLVLSHWFYETVRWIKCAPAGFRGILYTFYAGIYNTFIPDTSSFKRSLITNVIMATEAGFFYISASFTGTYYTFNDSVYYISDFMVKEKIILSVIFLSHTIHICLSWLYCKIKNK